MPQRFSHGTQQVSSPARPQNTRLRNLRRRIRATQKARHPSQRPEGPAPGANNGSDRSSGDTQPPDRYAPDITRTEVSDDDVVLNFENMDQDCALRPITTIPATRSSKNHRSSKGVWDPSMNKDATDKSQAPDSLSAGHRRLTTDEKGQLRYFGYSSLMRMVSVLPPSSPANSATSAAATSQDGPENKISADMAALADSTETHLHLMDLFFKYQHAALPVFDEPAFREAYTRGKRTEYYSTFLLHSLLLRALKFSTLPHSDKLKIIYLRRIRSDLLFEIENPSIATIPALCMFGSYMAGEGSDRACWLYPGLAFRLLYDFGLHEDCSELVNSGRLTETDRRIRHSILYHCYIFDKLYSSFQGRPTAVRVEDISCPLPSLDVPGSESQAIAAFVRLSSILEDILPIINGRRLQTIYQLSSVEKLSRASNGLVEWFKALPSELQWDSSAVHLPTPATCALHIHFLSVTILLNRPFAAYMLKSFDEKKDAGGCVENSRLSGQTPEVSQRICTTSSIRIAKILWTYRSYHGANKFFSTINPACLSASIALISDVVSAEAGEDKAEERKWLAVILDTLKEITPTYPVAGRSFMVLCAIAKACGLRDLLPSSSSPGPSGGPDVGNNMLDQLLQSPGAQQLGAEDMVWNMNGSLGWEFYPMLGDVHDIGLTDFYPRLSPWPPATPDYRNWLV